MNLSWDWRELLELAGAIVGVLVGLAFLAKHLYELWWRQKHDRERQQQKSGKGGAAGWHPEGEHTHVLS